MVQLPFRDRLEAGRLLGAEVAARHFNFRENTIVLGLPRGGVVVGSAIAAVLRAPLDVIVVRKIGVPLHPELAMGAIAGGRVRVLDEELIEELRIPRNAVREAIVKEMEEIEHREKLYRSERPAPDLHGCTVVLADDGLATGSTMMAAIEYAGSFRPETLLAAVPVGSSEAVDRIRSFVTDCICLATPEPFYSVGQWYGNFDQVTDEEVVRLLEQNYHRFGPLIRTVRAAR